MASKILAGAEVPVRLRDLPSPPARLFLHGELPIGVGIGIVGTRKATRASLRFAKGLASQVAAAGYVVISGGAKGIDTAAHRGALSVGGRTLVLAPAGFDRPFPEQNRALFKQIVKEGGGYLSHMADDAPIMPGASFVRNGMLVALCHALVVVECPCRSGARNAARWARHLGRPLFVVPQPPWNDKGIGCNLEISRGARVFESSERFLRWLESDVSTRALTAVQQVLFRQAAPEPTVAALAAARVAPAPGQATTEVVLRSVRAGAATADAVCEATGLAVQFVQAALVELELTGSVTTDENGRLVPQTE